MSKSIMATQYAMDGSSVHVIVATGKTVEVTADDGQKVTVPETETIDFAAMPEWTTATMNTKFKVEDYVVQCEREVQAIIDAEATQMEMVEVKRV